MNQPQHGPGPVIHGQDITNPSRYIVQHNGGQPQLLTATEIAQLPIQHQWFTGTINGLIASWCNREVAELSATQRGVLLGQIMPMSLDELAVIELPADLLPVLCDQHGRPLRAER